MEDEAIPAVPVAKQSPLDGLKRLFDTLLPPESIKFRDEAGNEYTSPPSLPIRREQKLVAKLSEVFDIPGSKLKGGLNVLTTKQEGREQIGALLGMAKELIKDEAVLKIVGEAFVLAHPLHAASAILAVKGDPRLSAFLDGGAEPTVLDAFSGAEMLGALLPFGAGVVTGIKNKIATLSLPTT